MLMRASALGQLDIAYECKAIERWLLTNSLSPKSGDTRCCLKLQGQA